MPKKPLTTIVEVHPACAALKGLEGTRLVVEYEEQNVRRTLEGLLLYPPAAHAFYLGEWDRYGIVYAEHHDASDNAACVHTIRTLDGKELYRRS